jgi:hypothetical protein
MIREHELRIVALDSPAKARTSESLYNGECNIDRLSLKEGYYSRFDAR